MILLIQGIIGDSVSICLLRPVLSSRINVRVPLFFPLFFSTTLILKSSDSWLVSTQFIHCGC